MSVLPELEQALTGAVARSRRPALPRRGRRWTARTLVLAVMVTGTSAAAVAATGVLGTLAPEADRPLPVLGADRSQTLAAYRGRPLVVTFYASWCDPCRQQARIVDELARTLRAGDAGDAVLIGLKDQDVPARRFVAEFGLQLTVLQDPDGAVAKAFGAFAVPWTFVIDAEGRLASDHPGLLSRSELDRAVAAARARE